MSRYARRVDDNHQEIIAVYRAHGFSIKDTSRLTGFVDLVVGAHGRNYLVEVKDGAKSKSRQALTRAEEDFPAGWRGQITIVRNVDDVLRHCAGVRAQRTDASR